MVEIDNNPSERTIRVRMSGFIDVPEMKKVCADFRRVSESYRGRPHMVLADMRGLKPFPPEGAAMFAEVISYDRAHGCVHCAHLNDAVITRMQTRRLAREASPDGDKI